MMVSALCQASLLCYPITIRILSYQPLSFMTQNFLPEHQRAFLWDDSGHERTSGFILPDLHSSKSKNHGRGRIWPVSCLQSHKASKKITTQLIFFSHSRYNIRDTTTLHVGKNNDQIEARTQDLLRTFEMLRRCLANVRCC
jgi:hypothetical protein